jgi:hypothetical protein
MLFSMSHTGVLATLLSLVGVVVANVVDREGALDRRKNSQICSGTAQEVILSAGSDIILTNEGFEDGEFIGGCTTLYEVMMDRDDQDLGQWRIKVTIERMNLHCSSSSLWLIEDGERTHNDQYCNEKMESSVFYSHEHLIDIKFKNKAKCGEATGCAGTQVEVRVSAEYVCGGRFDKDNGVITSPLFPANYVNSEACFYDIVAPRRKRIALTCDYFNLATKCEGHCGSHNGDKTYFQDITTFERYEGSELQGKTIKSKKNHHTFYFLSNSDDIEHKKQNKNKKYGFRCSYTFVDK